MNDFGKIIEYVTYNDILNNPQYFYSLVLKHKVVVFRDMPMGIGGQSALMEKIYPSNGYMRIQKLVDHEPLFKLFANVGLDLPKEDEVFARWHTDDSWLEYVVDVNSISMQHLSKDSLGGKTVWVDLEAAFLMLTAEEIEFLKTVRVSNWNADQHPENNEVRKDEVEHKHMPLRTHPESGVSSIFYTGPSIFDLDNIKWQEMLNKFNAMFDDHDLLFENDWEQNDFVVWDNRNTAHKLMGGFSLGERIINKVEIGRSKPFYSGL